MTISGESEVANPWTPAAMQCDPYCYQRALTFFDMLGVVGADHQVHPYLAESITPNSVNSQWTVKIRPGVNFTDGTPVNADAVIRNLNEAGAAVLLAGLLVDVARNPDKTFVIDKTDDLTITLHTGKNGDPTQPISYPAFPFLLATQWAMIASPTWLDAVKADATKASQPVGSGPFVVQSYAPRDSLVVTRNPNYWLKDAHGIQLPYLDKVTFRVIESAETAKEALDNGELGVFSTSASSVIADLRKETDNIGLREQNKYGDTYYLLMDVSKQPVDDARVRCALSMAIDRTELNDLVGAGLPQIANGVFSPGQEGYLDDNGFSTDQNIDAAKQLIDDYKSATGAKSVKVELGGTAEPITQQAQDLIKGYWSQIGVDTQLDTVPQDQYITNALFGAPTVMIYQWRSHAGTIVDQQNLWWNSRSSAPDGSLALNFGRLNDPQVDADLSTARSDPDPAKRKAAAEDINRTFAKQCYQIPLSWTIWATASAPNVKGFNEATAPDGAPLLEPNATNAGGIMPTASLWVEK
jgi:peptide/nickel transport system substrate-binding protein